MLKKIYRHGKFVCYHVINETAVQESFGPGGFPGIHEYIYVYVWKILRLLTYSAYRRFGYNDLWVSLQVFSKFKRNNLDSLVMF